MLENSRMTQTDQEIAGSARFFRSLLDNATPHETGYLLLSGRSFCCFRWADMLG